MRPLLINVQVDRLPNPSETEVQIGIRVSAAINPTGGDPDVENERERVLPWNWGKDAASLPGSWNPHARAPKADRGSDGWTIWRVPKSATEEEQYEPILVEGEAIAFIEGPAHVDPEEKLKKSVRASIETAIGEGGAAALERPTGNEISGRKVFALVETLTSLPAPVPAHFKVWSCATIDTTKLGEPPYDRDDIFIAAPQFGLDGFFWQPQDVPIQKVTDEVTRLYKAVLTHKEEGDEAKGDEFEVEIHPSLPLSKLLRLNSNQLIEPATLWIFKGEAEDFEHQDWTLALQSRIADAIDPAARALAVAQTAIKEALNENAKRRDALLNDLSGGDLLRKLLTALQGATLWPRRRSSNAAVSPALSFLASVAEQDSKLWPEVVPMLLALADESNGQDENWEADLESDLRDILPQPASGGAMRVTALSRDTLLAAAGRRPEPKSPNWLDPQGTAVLEDPAGFLSFLIFHWTNPKPRAPQKNRRLGMQQFEWVFENGKAKQVSRSAPILDLRQIVSDRDISIPIPFLVRSGTGENTAIVRLQDAEKKDLVVVHVTLNKTANEAKVGHIMKGGPERWLDFVAGCKEEDNTYSWRLKLIVDVKPGPAGPGAALKIQCLGKDGASKETDSLQLPPVVFAGGLGFQIEPGFKRSVYVEPDTPASVRDRLGELIRKQGADAWRAALSLSAAGPSIPWLLNGRPAYEGAQREKIADPDSHENEPIAKRLPWAVEQTIRNTFQAAFDKAKAVVAPTGLPKELQELVDKIKERAQQDAEELAHRLVPPSQAMAAGDGDTRPVAQRIAKDGLITETAQPLIFAIDQLRDFGEGDLWTRLAGLGVLIGRSDDGNPSEKWWSLNVATLHANSDNGTAVRQQLYDGDKSHNAVYVREAHPENWREGARVDPVPLSVSEVSGVRDALIRYEGQSIVAEMWSAPRLETTQSCPPVPRRPEAYLFPPPTVVTQDSEKFVFPRLPPLTFGRWYHIIPYLVGHGGVLPVQLRQSGDSRNPTALIEIATLDDGGQITIPLSKILRDVVRSTRWLRTRPVGAPRLASESSLPVTPPDVAPLAAELPIRPAVVTLYKEIPSRWFLDKSLQRGIIEGPKAGIRIEIGELEGETTDSITIRVWDGLVPGNDRLCAEMKVQGPFNKTGLRIHAADGFDKAGLFTLEWTHTTGWAEDEPKASPLPETQIKKNRVTVSPSEWHYAFIELVSNTTDMSAEPPQIALISMLPKALNKSYLKCERVILPPEAAHHTRRITVLDGIGFLPRTGQDHATIQVCRPTLDLGSYDSWINGPLSKTGFGTKERGEIEKIRLAVNQAHRLVKIVAGQEDRSLDDTAVEALAIEVVQVFPKRVIKVEMKLLAWLKPEDDIRRRLGTAEALKHGASWVSIEVGTGEIFNYNLNEASSPGRQSKARLTLLPGHIYEVRLYGAVPQEQPSFGPGGTRIRFTNSAANGWRRLEENGVWQLGAPLTLTFEVATKEVPSIAKALVVSLDRSPESDRDHAVLRLDPHVLKYPEIRYVDRVALMKQRWSWRGRAHPVLSAHQVKCLGYDGQADEAIIEFVEAAFIGRDDDDIGEVHEARIARSHSFAGRRTISKSAPGSNGEYGDEFNKKVPILMREDLAYRAGAHLWRYALRAKSRYAALRPNDSRLISFSHRDPKRPEHGWHALVVPDRPGDRRPKRPGISLILPLTEPLMTQGAVPPLLALFNETMYPQFNAGDGIETVVEVTRHPLPSSSPVIEAERVGGTIGEESNVRGGPIKYWPEFGYDPVRTGDSVSGTPLALRTDGPIGYTFDPETEAGRFDHSGLLVSPVVAKSQEVRPWSMLKLRFRRLEMPEFMRSHLDGDSLAKPFCGQKPENGQSVTLHHVVRLENRPNILDDSLSPPDGIEKITFETTHEGIVLDIPNMRKGALAGFAVSFCDPKNWNLDPQSTGVTAKIEGHTLTIDSKTNLGNAGIWVFDGLKPDSQVSVRVVISQRPRPAGVEKYRPSGDVSIRVHISRMSSVDALRHPAENAWLSVLCMPLAAGQECTREQPAFVRLNGSTPGNSTVRPVRLSDFTPGIWCQYAAGMSRFEAELAMESDEGDSHVNTHFVTMDQIELAKVHPKKGLKLKDHWAEIDGKIKWVTLRPEGRPDLKSQLEERLYAVITHYVTDAFDRLRERPMAVYAVAERTMNLTGSQPVWDTAEMQDEKPFDKKRGRVRFLRILWGKSREDGGFMPPMDERERFQSLFSPAIDSDVNPPDAIGMALGISIPLEWECP